MENDPLYKDALLQAIIAGFNSVPDLMRVSTSDSLVQEAKEILDILGPNSDSKKAFNLAHTRAKQKWKDLQIAEQQLTKQKIREQNESHILEEKAELARITEIAKIELEEYISKLLMDKSLSWPQIEAIKYFKSIYLDGKRDQEIAYLFPRTTRDQRYQWKSRANRMIAPYVSEDARKFISMKSKIKYANLYDSACLFLNNVLENEDL